MELARSSSAQSNSQMNENQIDSILCEIEGYVAKVNELFEKRKLFYSEDISFFENLLKQINNSLSTLSPVAEPTIQNHRLSNDPIGLLLNGFTTKFQTIQAEIKTKVIPVLKEQQEHHINCASTFNTKFNGVLNEMKKVIRLFQEKCSKERASQKEQSLDDCVKKIFVVGNQFHSYYTNFYDKIPSFEEKLKTELISAEVYLNKAALYENTTIEEITKLITDSFPYLKSYTQLERIIKPEDTIVYYQAKITTAFFSMKCVQGPPIIFSNAMTGKIWESEPIKTQFHARVWENYSPQNDDELEVHKKEMVLVIEPTEHLYWKVKKENQTGYVPYNILEPLT